MLRAVSFPWSSNTLNSGSLSSCLVLSEVTPAVDIILFMIEVLGLSVCKAFGFSMEIIWRAQIQHAFEN